MINAENFIKQIKDFPTLPTIYTALMDTMANPRSTAQDVADIISQDQSSASKVLKTANSSIYGFRGKIGTITQAITYIGFDEVKNLVIALSIMKLFKNMKGVKFNPLNLWKHSLAVGATTRIIGKTIGVKNLENFFIAGILHQIGKLVLYKFLPEEYPQVISNSIEKRISIRESEKEKLGITYNIVGEMLAEHWKLPISIKDAIRYHPTGILENNNKVLVASIHIAKTAASMLELGLEEGEVVPEPNPEAWKILQLPDKFFVSYLDKILNDYEESVMLLLKN